MDQTSGLRPTEIVSRLRSVADWQSKIDAAETLDNENIAPNDYLWWEAADEIERLRNIILKTSQMSRRGELDKKESDVERIHS